MEGTHGELGTRLTDRLRRDDSHREPLFDRSARREVHAVALRANTERSLASQRASNPELRITEVFDLSGHLLSDQFVLANQDFVRLHVFDGSEGGPAHDASSERDVDFVTTVDDFLGNPVEGSAIVDRDHHVLSNVRELTSEVSGVRSLQCGVCQSLSCSVSRREVLEDSEALSETRLNRSFDDLPRRLRHQSPHSRQLADLRDRSSRARSHHDVNRIHVGLTRRGVIAEAIHQLLTNLFGRVSPQVDDLVVPLTLGNHSVAVEALDLIDLALGFLENPSLCLRETKVVDREAHPRPGRSLESELLHVIEKLQGRSTSETTITVVNDPLQILLAEILVIERHSICEEVVEDDAARGGGVETVFIRGLGVTTLTEHFSSFRHPDSDLRMPMDLARPKSGEDLCHRRETHAVSGHAIERERQVEAAEHDVLRRCDDRVAVSWREDVVRRQHQVLGLDLGLDRQRQMHCHLVTIKVGVETLADERVDQDSVPLDQDRLKRLNSHPVQRGRAIQENRVPFGDLLEDVPNFFIFAFQHLLRALDRIGIAQFLEATNDEWLEEFERDLLRQTALVEFQLRTNCDHRSSAVIHPLAQEVFAESTLLTLDHVGQGLKRSVVRTEHRATTTVVVEESIHRVLQHPLLVADDHLGCIEIEKFLETIVSVDQTTIEVVEVRGREVAALEKNERTEIGWDHRNNILNHPLGIVPRRQNRLNNPEASNQVRLLLFGARGLVLLLKLLCELCEIDPTDHLTNRLCAHVRDKGLAVLFQCKAILFLAEKLLLCERSVARIDHDVILVVDHPFEVGGLHVEEIAQARGHRLEEPDMNRRRSEIDVAHATAAHPRVRDLDSATVADNPLVLDPFILTA